MITVVRTVLKKSLLGAMRYDLITHLFPLSQELCLLLQDLFVELGVKEETAALSLHHGAAEVSETPLEATLIHCQLEEETLGQSQRPQASFQIQVDKKTWKRLQTFVFLQMNEQEFYSRAVFAPGMLN